MIRLLTLADGFGDSNAYPLWYPKYFKWPKIIELMTDGVTVHNLSRYGAGNEYLTRALQKNITDADCVLMKVKSKVEKFLATQKIEQMERDQVLPTLDFGGVPKLESVGEPFKELELDSIAEEIWSDKGLEKYSGKAKYFLENRQLGAAWKLARDIWQRGDEESLLIAGKLLGEVYAKSARLPFQKILELHLADLNREWLDLTDSV